MVMEVVPRSADPSAERPRWCSSSANKSPKVDADGPLALTVKSNPSKPTVDSSVVADTSPATSYRRRRSGSLSVSYGGGNLTEPDGCRPIARVDVRVASARERL